MESTQTTSTQEKNMTYMTKAHKTGSKKLASIGIKTMGDVDSRKGCESRFSYLKSLVGFDAAMWILNDLSNKSC
jgi:hypothetical protein